MSFNYSIKETIGIISKKLNGETLELKVIRYGNYDKFDLRRWSDNVMYKGITLNIDELKALKTLLNQYLTSDNNLQVIIKQAILNRISQPYYD